MNLAEAIAEEQARCRALLVEYVKIGPIGIFGATLIEDMLRDADSALASGDVTRILIAYENLRGVE